MGRRRDHDCCLESRGQNLMEFPKITKTEFEEYLKEFFNWTTEKSRSKESWLLSLQDWAEWQYNRCFASSVRDES